jgi:hypothetical protein
MIAIKMPISWAENPVDFRYSPQYGTRAPRDAK